MRNFILAIVGLLLVALLVFLVWQVIDPNDPPFVEAEPVTTDGDAAVSDEESLPSVVANDDTVETMVNMAVPINVTTNDQGENLLVQMLTTGPVNGTAVVQTDPLSILYTPNNNFVGNDSFTYDVCNSASVCDSAQVTIAIRDFQLSDDQFTTPKNLTLEANVQGNDNGDLSVTTAPVNQPANGTLTLQESGEFTFVPSTNFVGEDSFAYEACNTSSMCATAMVLIKVGGPALEADSVKTTLNKPVSGNVLLNDLGDSLEVNETPASAPADGGVVLLADGRFTYTPGDGFEGSDTFTYETCDSDGLCAAALVTIQVEPAPTSAMHTVSHGEWLLQIARCYGTTVSAIRAHNYIYNPNYIYPGQVLYIPDIGSVGPYYGAPCVDYHMVEAGETLESIAAANNISESELARINGLYTYYYSYCYDYYCGYSYYCCGYYAYPCYSYYSYRKDIYEGQILILPQPVPDYMRPGT